MACVERATLFSHLANVGDTRSLILHPASTTHRQLDEESRLRAGAGDDVLRLSIGLESVPCAHPAPPLHDVRRGLPQSPGRKPARKPAAAPPAPSLPRPQQPRRRELQLPQGAFER